MSIDLYRFAYMFTLLMLNMAYRVSHSVKVLSRFF